MNKLSKIALSVLCIMSLFLLPVTYADSEVLTSVYLNGEEISSAEEGQMVTIRAKIDKANEGDYVTFESTNSALAFIDPETGKEIDGTIEKEVTLNEDGSGSAEVSAKTKSSEQFSLNATVRDKATELTEESLPSEEEISSESENTAQTEKTDVTNDATEEKDSVTDSGSTVEESTQGDTTQENKENSNTASSTETQDKLTSESANTQAVNETDKENTSQENTAAAGDSKLVVKSDSTKVSPNETVNLSAELTPEVKDASVLEKVNWKISYSGKEITPDNPAGSVTSFKVPEDAKDTQISVSATLPKDSSPTGEELKAEDLSINTAAAGTKKIEIYASTDDEDIPVGTDIGFSSEILDGEYVADSTVKEDAHYSWFAQLDNVYLNGTSFGSTFSVYPTETGELKVWVTATLKDGSELKSEPIIKTIVQKEDKTTEDETEKEDSNSEEKVDSSSETTDSNEVTTSSSVVITPIPQNKKSSKPGEKITFTRNSSVDSGIDEKGAKFNWIAKMGDETIDEQTSKANFTVKPESEGTLIVTLTITPKDGEAVVSDPVKVKITNEDNPDDEPIQMIPENDKEGSKESDTQTDTEEKTEEIPSETTPVKIDDQSKEPSTTENNSSESDADDNILKLTGAEITTKNDVSNVHVGDNIVLDADITTDGGSGEVSYKWEAIDSRGNIIATSQKLDNFEIKATEPGDVTVNFEVSSKDPNSPEGYKSAKAQKVISFKSADGSPEVVAAKIDNPNNKEIKTDGQTTNQNSGQTQSSGSKSKSSGSSSKNTGSSSKKSSGSSKKTGGSSNNSNSTKNTSSTDSKSNNSSSTDSKNSTNSSTPSSAKTDTNKVASTKSPSLKTTQDDKKSTTSSTKPSFAADFNQNINKALSTPTGFINPTNGKSFTIGQVGAALLTTLGIAIVVYALISHKKKLDDDSTNYYL